MCTLICEKITLIDRKLVELYRPQILKKPRFMVLLLFTGCAAINFYCSKISLSLFISMSN